MEGSFKKKLELMEASYKEILVAREFCDTYDDASVNSYFRFFGDCRDLKDWIVNDDSIDSDKNEVEELFENSENLRKAGSLADAFKHKKLTRSHHLDKEIDLKEIGLVMMYSDKQYGKRVYVYYNGRNMQSAFELASSCFVEWQEFIDKGGIK